MRASLAVGGRSLTLYEEVHRGSKLGNRKVQERFLQDREPWLLVASPRFADRPPKVLVRLYRQRMQIEESFRDMQSLYFGQGYDINGLRDLERVAILVMIAALAAILLWMIGAAAERLELHHGMHATQE